MQAATIRSRFWSASTTIRMLGRRSAADILHLCWERGGDRPQDLVTPALMDRAFAEGREIVLWHEERRSILDDIMKLPVLGICTDLPDHDAHGLGWGTKSWQTRIRDRAR
jgi:hypothetical protein